MNQDILDFVQHLQIHDAPTTLIRKRWQIEAYLKYLEALKKNYANATKADVESFLLSLKCTVSFRQSVCCTIRQFYAFTFKYTNNNPAMCIRFKTDQSKHLPESVPSESVLHEKIALLSGKDTDLSIRDHLMAELAYGSGIRRDELRKLNIEDIDFDEKTLVVTGKGNKMRKVPVTENALTVARNYFCKRNAFRGPLLVSYRGKRLTCNGVYQIMRDRVGVRPHLLRHACASHMLANGASIRVIQELLGHKDLRSTQVYISLEKDQLRQVINRSHPRRK